MKHLVVERVFCMVSGILLAAAGIPAFLFVNHFTGLSLFAAGAVLFWWARTQKKLTRRLEFLINAAEKTTESQSAEREV